MLVSEPAVSWGRYDRISRFQSNFFSAAAARDPHCAVPRSVHGSPRLCIPRTQNTAPAGSSRPVGCPVRGGASPRLCTVIVFWHARCLGLVPFCFPRVTPGLSLVRRAPGPPAGLGSFLSTELRVSHLRNASSSGIDPGRDPGLQFEKICCIS